jgi:hypothetical protein
MDASDSPHVWQALNVRVLLKAARTAGGSRKRWLLAIPCVLALPSLLFLGVGSFASTAGLQKFFSTGPGPKILMGFGIAALAWIAYQLAALLRTWRTASAQPTAELLAVHRFRLGTALGSATTGALLLWRGFGDTGPAGMLMEKLDGAPGPMEGPASKLAVANSTENTPTRPPAVRRGMRPNPAATGTG